jgi:hypothetical protein
MVAGVITKSTVMDWLGLEPVAVVPVVVVPVFVVVLVVVEPVELVAALAELLMVIVPEQSEFTV